MLVPGMEVKKVLWPLHVAAGLILNCVSGADQASDRSPEVEMPDSPPGIGIHLAGTRR